MRKFVGGARAGGSAPPNSLAAVKPATARNAALFLPVLGGMGACGPADENRIFVCYFVDSVDSVASICKHGRQDRQARELIVFATCEAPAAWSPLSRW